MYRKEGWERRMKLTKRFKILMSVLTTLILVTIIVRTLHDIKTTETVSDIDLNSSSMYISKVTGTGEEGYFGDGGQPTGAKLNKPRGIYIDKSNNMYIADTQNQRIRMIPKKDGTYFGIDMTKGNIYTIAGNDVSGYSGDNEKAIEAQLNLPQDIVLDNAGNLYIADTWNNCVRKVDTKGIITTIAGTSQQASVANGDDKKATETDLGRIGSVTIDNTGKLYIVEEISYSDSYIRKIDLDSGSINTITSGEKGKEISYGDERKTKDTKMGNIKQIIFDSDNNMYVSEGNVVFMIPNKDGVYFNIPMKAENIYFIAGRYDGSTYQGDGVTGTGVKLKTPWGIVVDSVGNLYISDRDNYKIRFVDRNSGIISDILGDGAKGIPEEGSLAKDSKVGWINSIAIDSGDKLYLSDYDNNSIYLIEEKNKAKNPPSLKQDFNKNKINNPVELTFEDDRTWRKAISKVYVNDIDIKGKYKISEGKIVIKKEVFENSGIHIIRVRAKGYKDSIMVKKINDVAKVLKPDITDSKVGHKIEITFEDDEDWRYGVLSYSTKYGVYINDKPTAKYHFEVGKLVLDQSTITERGTYTIKIKSLGYEDSIVKQKILEREKTTESEITLGEIGIFAGTGEKGYLGEGVLPTQAKISANRIYIDKKGNVFLSDTTNQRIRMIPKESGIYYGIDMVKGNIYTVAGDGTKESKDFGSYGGDGGKAIQAKLNNPRNVVVDKRGNLYISDYANQTIRKVDNQGNITTIIGTKGRIPGSDTEKLQGEGGLAKDALIRTVSDIYIDDEADILYFAQQLRVRKVDLQTRIISTVAGAKSEGGHIASAIEAKGNGEQAEDAQFNVINSFIYDKNKNLYIIDNHQIRMIPNESGSYFGVNMKGGNIYTISGHYFINDYFGDGYSANDARLRYPIDIKIDSRGNLYIADEGNNAIRFISKNSGTIHTIIGKEQEDFAGISGLAIDSEDNLYFTDRINNKVYQTKINYKK